jgi:hypothetical protein
MAGLLHPWHRAGRGGDARQQPGTVLLTAVAVVFLVMAVIVGGRQRGT